MVEKRGGRSGRSGRSDERSDERGGRRGLFRRRKVCRFCVDKINYINYKDARMLMPFLPERGKIQPRRLSGTCAMHQRKLQTAIKLSRQQELVPYLSD